jgi:hypothetical protein
MHVRAQVFHAHIPEGHPYHAAPVAVYQSLNDFVGSFRHALFDFILPVFNLLQLFRMYTPDFLLIEAQHQVRPWVACFVYILIGGLSALAALGFMLVVTWGVAGCS